MRALALTIAAAVMAAVPQAPASAQSGQYFMGATSADGYSVVFLESTKIRRVSDNVYMAWITFINDINHPVMGNIKSVTSLIKLDCSDDSYQIISSTSYDKDKNNLATNSGDGKITYIAPNTIMSVTENQICAGDNRNEKYKDVIFNGDISDFSDWYFKNHKSQKGK